MRIREILKEAPTGGYRLVRVVDGLDNIRPNSDGTLSILARYKGSTERNTVHFTANSVVGDHEAGSFPGQYIIIANPAEMPRDQLAGARAEDTWYRFDNNGELNIGRATILAPEGSAVPNGIKAQYYQGDRADAIDNAFKQIGTTYYGTTGRTGVPGLDKDYYKDFSAQYGTTATQGGHHDGSLDGYLETITGRLKYYLQHLQKSMDWVEPGTSGPERNVTTVANELISVFRQQLDNWAKANPEAFKASASYFNYIIKVLDTYQAIFTRAEQVYLQQEREYTMALKGYNQWKKTQGSPSQGQPPPLSGSTPPPMPGAQQPQKPTYPAWPPAGLNLAVPNIPMPYQTKIAEYK